MWRGQRCRFLRWFDTRRRRTCSWTSIHSSTRWSKSRSTWPRCSCWCPARRCCCSTPSRSCDSITPCYYRSSRTTPIYDRRLRISRSRSSTPVSRRFEIDRHWRHEWGRAGGIYLLQLPVKCQTHVLYVRCTLFFLVDLLLYCVISDIHWCILLFCCGMLVAAVLCHKIK